MFYDQPRAYRRLNGSYKLGMKCSNHQIWGRSQTPAPEVCGKNKPETTPIRSLFSKLCLVLLYKMESLLILRDVNSAFIYIPKIQDGERCKNKLF
jgi:hypothetical protein